MTAQVINLRQKRRERQKQAQETKSRLKRAARGLAGAKRTEADLEAKRLDRVLAGARLPEREKPESQS